MRWKNSRRSRNVEDRRGSRIPGGAKGAGLGVVLLALVAMFFGGDAKSVLSMLMQSGGASVGAASDTAVSPPANDKLSQFVSAVLADTEDVWNQLFAQMGSTYQEPKLVLFTEAVQSACGTQSSAVGPFYCPGDNKVYLDLTFFEELKSRHRAPGDFAQAYVIAHEIGHHVQNLLGISRQVHSLQQGASKTEANELSVRLELQADFLAGVWAHHAERTRQVLEEGDVEEALNAASSIGDDRLQREARGHVSPDSFTHGTSAQRVHWFRLGLQTGDLSRGNTLEAKNL